MAIKNPPVRSVVYLLILCAALIFSLYNLFSDDAKSWFLSNKKVSVNPVYGRVITTGAGRSLASYKNDDSGGLDALLMEEWEGDSYLMMVPGDIIHLIFLVTTSDPAIISDSQLTLHDIYGDNSLRGDCTVFENTIRLTKVSCTEVVEDDVTKYVYEYDQNWQNLPNEALPSLQSDNPELSFGIGEVAIDGEIVDVGSYAGQYVFLLDVPVLYRDTGYNQNAQKSEYYINIEGEYVPVPGSSIGRIEIARCSFVQMPE